MKTNSIDIAAKLLATENITIIRAAVRTASFDITSRVLTIPQWKEMTPEQEQMLVGHEVGHAKYTTEEYVDVIKEDRKLMSYLNVIEDVRIEKLMKREYPGIRKVMAEGYRQLNDRDFFGVSKIPDLSVLNLIDRINLYFKAGYQCGVKFIPAEKVYVDACERTETVHEVIALAKEVYNYSKENIEQQIQERQKQKITEEGDDEKSSDFDEFEEYGDFEELDTEEGDGDSFKEKIKENSGTFGKPTVEQQKKSLEEELESKTEKTFNQKLEALADINTKYLYYSLEEDYKFDPLVGFKRILSETANVDNYIYEEDKVALEKYKIDSSRVVSYLTKEFEMRKSATLYKRAQTSKSGSLDMRKVWSYKLNDDLFKRITTVPHGKNHGMVFLLDWSGSMDLVLEDTMKQVISLAMFCHRVQIPYQVLAFSSHYDVSKNNRYLFSDLRKEFFSSDETLKINKVTNSISPFALLELFSHKMSNGEFNTMMRRFINPNKVGYTASGDYSTGGTPLNEALAYMVSYLPKFAKTNNVEKMSLITLTDGDGAILQSNLNNNFRAYTFECNDRIKTRHF
jgi:HPt (histidine-containing phosphotransfer) domain-containing protein